MDLPQARLAELIRYLCHTEDSSDLFQGLNDLLSASQSLMDLSTQQSYGIVIRNALSHEAPDIREKALKLVNKQWFLESPSKTATLKHYCFDIDSGVRRTALELLNTEFSFFLQFLDDEDYKVIIAALEGYFRCSVTRGDQVFFTLSKMTYSTNQNVILCALRLLALTQPTVQGFTMSLAGESIKHETLFEQGFLLRMLESDSCEVRVAVLTCIDELLRVMLTSNLYDSLNSLIYKVVKLLLDAINDEFIEVRILVFEILSRLSPHFYLRKKPEVDSCVFNLVDAEPRLRYALYSFLSYVRIENFQRLHFVINALLEQFSKYPDDKDHLLSVFTKLGKVNSRLARQLLPKVLELDKRFLDREQDWNDLTYVAKLIFFYNASLIDANIELPALVTKHIHYLADVYPAYVPLKNLSLDIHLDNYAKHSFSTDYDKLMKQAKKLLAQPHAYLSEARRIIRLLVEESCRLQHSYNVTLISGYPWPSSPIIKDC
mmetsp:Transcript_27318/g.49133  ORF Transcript_27318/g.49133 Transcript_27318/m.49133 type:complete len:489 (-) Transcript_27318:613-2079(-)